MFFHVYLNSYLELNMMQAHVCAYVSILTGLKCVHHVIGPMGHAIWGFA